MTNALIDSTANSVGRQMVDLAKKEADYAVIKATYVGDNDTYLTAAGWIHGIEGVAAVIYTGRIGLRHVIGIVLDGNLQREVAGGLRRIEALEFAFTKHSL
ncbi:MAG TPA: hypothetical protein VK502_00225 [Candidatus Saccharimonadales bacterium]|nr:hypothetical protein [Candidatus Saccharimonadales bacterium]